MKNEKNNNQYTRYDIWYLTMYEPLPVLKKDNKCMRSADLAKALSNKNIKTLLINTDFDHHTKKFYYPERSFQTFSKFLSIKYLKSIGYNNDVSLRRYLHNRHYASQFTKFANNQLYKPKLLVTQIPSLEMGEAVYKYCTTNKIPYVIDIRDIYPDNYRRMFPNIFSFFYPILFKIEELKKRKILNNAKGITAVSNTFARWAEKSLSKNSNIKPKVFYIGYNTIKKEKSKVDLEIGKSNTFLLKHNIPFNKKLVIYVGTFNNLLNFNYVFETFERLERNNDSQWHLCIAGKGYNEKYIARRCSVLSNCSYIGWLTEQEMHLLKIRSHIGLMPIDIKKSKYLSMGNKLFEYMAYGLPTLNSLVGELSLFIESNNIGLNFNMLDSDSLTRQLFSFDIDKELYTIQSSNAINLYKKEFQRDIIYEKFSSYLIEKMIENR